MVLRGTQQQERGREENLQEWWFYLELEIHNLVCEWIDEVMNCGYNQQLCDILKGYCTSMTDACLDQVPTQSEEKMVSSHDGKISKVEVLDRLSNLSDDLIHKILSFISLKQAVETSVLSSRWRFIWKSMSYLNISNFVEAFFSYRIKDIEVSFVKLSFSTYFTQWFVKSIFKYVFTHNIPQVTIICSIDYDNIVMPLNFSGSQSLKHLSLIKDTCTTQSRCFIRSLSGCELPELTTLYLSSLTCFISDVRDIDFFKCLLSTCPKLMNLTLKGLKTFESNSVSICHPLLSNLTLEDGDYSVVLVNLVAPRHKNLTIINMPEDFQLVVSAPELASLVCKGYYPVELKTDGFHCLEKADLCVYNTHNAGAHKMVFLLQHVYNVKSLTLNLEIVEVY
ncbi:putative F-box/LRR-repeat protein At4g15060 [Rutidosis leptorrhynchoides]|uniref:putative F-box/LRR-repeat protein At4g15060 n=1 Tax=Rutidosis leptorrhynchoides TaxID=125765 RepID=UPI003A99138B